MMAAVVNLLGSHGLCTQPRQTASTCECGTRHPTAADLPPGSPLPRCVPSMACDSTANTSSASVSAAELAGATILIVFNHDPGAVRYWYKSDPFRSYLNSMRLIFRLVLSLQQVGTRLPIHLLISGERSEPFEASLRARGVTLLEAAGPRFHISTPPWASSHHRGSFHHLKVLALTQFRQLIVLDPDVIALRNIDHLATAPAPGAVFRFKCFRHNKGRPKDGERARPIWEMNGGVLLLRPSESEHLRMQELMNCNNHSSQPQLLRGKAVGSRTIPCTAHLHIPNDPSDQSVLRHFLRAVYELPIGFNTFKTSNMSSEDWGRVHLLHDVDVSRSKKWPSKPVHSRVAQLTQQAAELVDDVARAAGIKNRG